MVTGDANVHFSDVFLKEVECPLQLLCAVDPDFLVFIEAEQLAHAGRFVECLRIDFELFAKWSISQTGVGLR